MNAPAAAVHRPQQRYFRKVAEVAIAANGFATVQMPRDLDYEAIMLRIVASVQVTVGGSAVRAEAPVQLVQRVELIADGKNNIAQEPFWALGLGNYARPINQANARVTTPPSAASAATYAVEAIGVIDLMTVDGVRPKDSNFRSFGLSMLDLRLTFGAPADIFVGATAAFSGSPVVEVYVQQVAEQPAADGSLTNPVFFKKVSYQELAIPSSNANQELLLPAGNQIKSVLLRAAGAVTAGEPSTAILNNAQLVNGVDVRHNLTGGQIRAKNNLDYGALPAGYYVLDVTSKGRAAINLSELWDVTGASQPKAILDVVGGTNNRIQAVVTEYIPRG